MFIVLFHLVCIHLNEFKFCHFYLCLLPFLSAAKRVAIYAGKDIKSSGVHSLRHSGQLFDWTIQTSKLVVQLAVQAG